jgi:enoyl-CoA hydratase/carnithine racemase
MMGASHRVVTETTRFAMPEISIGLFPDVGGTWMLARLPGGTGLFLALTGAQLGASDCYFLGLADYRLQSAQWDELIEAIGRTEWSEVRSDNDIRLRGLLLARQPQTESPQGPLQKHYPLIRLACDGMDFDAICRNILSWADHSDPWLKRASNTFAAGSPGSARLSFALLARTRLLSLSEAFRQEYIVSLHCGVEGDLQEGIRALLIEKDKQPKWRPATLELATDVWVQRFFREPWPDSEGHPLADLGQTMPN